MLQVQMDRMDMNLENNDIKIKFHYTIMIIVDGCPGRTSGRLIPWKMISKTMPY